MCGKRTKSDDDRRYSKLAEGSPERNFPTYIRLENVIATIKRMN